MRQFVNRLSLFLFCLIGILVLSLHSAGASSGREGTSFVPKTAPLPAEDATEGMGAIQGGTAVTTSKTVDFAPGGDLNNNGIVDEGDVLRYTVTATNNSGSDLTNVVFTDTIDANTTISGTVAIFPIAANDSLVVNNGGSINDNVTDNDSGVPPLQVISFGDSPATVGTFPADGVTVGAFPAPGGGTIDGTIAANGDISVTSNGTTGTGTVTLFYEIQAGNGLTDTGQISVTFGDSPTAVDDTLATLGAGNEYNTDVGVTLNVGAGTGLLNNDTLGTPAATLTQWGGGDASSNVDRNPGTSRPFAGGTLTVYTDGSFDLVNPTVPGVYTFDYIIDNGIGSSQATVEIYVNDPPVAQDDAFNASLSQTNNYAESALFNDNGSGADYLGAPPATIVTYGGGSLGGAVTDNVAGATVAIPVIGGTLTVNADGSFVVDSPTATGTFTFAYQIDNGIGTDTAVVTITIVATPVTQPDAFFMIIPNNLTGDLIADNGFGADDPGVPAFTSLNFGGGSLGGTVTDNAGGASVALASGTLTVNNDGTFTLNGGTTPGTYTFDYQLTNAVGASNISTVTIGVIDPPVARNDAITVVVGVVTNLPAPGLFADNGSGADYLGVPTATLVSFGSTDLGGAGAADNAAGSTVAIPVFGGTITINTNGSVVVNNPTAPGSFFVDYVIDNGFTSSIGRLTVTIIEAPIAQQDTYTFLFSVDQNIPAGSGLFVDNGSGADTLGFPAATLVSFGGGSLGGAVIDNAAGASVGLAGGTLTVNADGSWTLTGQPFTPGTYTFDYRIQNAAGFSDATVTLQVGAPPMCAADAYAATGNISINTINIAGNDVLQNDSGIGIVVTAVQSSGANVGVDTATTNGGTVNITAAGEFAYTPPTGFTGNDTFTYTIDNVANSPATCTVTITVTNLIYFMDSAAGAGGDGSLSAPFQSPAEHNGSIPANAILFIEDRGTAYTGSLTLANGERVIGEGTTGTLFGGGSLTGITLAALSDSVSYSTTGSFADWAQISSGGSIGIMVNANNTLSGIDIGNTIGAAGISSIVNVGTLTISETQITGTGGTLFLTNGGTLAATFLNLISTSSPLEGLRLDGVGGNLTVTGDTVMNGSTNEGIQVDNSPGGGAFNFGTTAVTKASAGDAISMTGNANSFTFINLQVTTTQGAGLFGRNNTGVLNIAFAATNDFNTGGSCMDLLNASGNQPININLDTCTATTNLNTFGIRLDNVGGTGLVIANATNITQAGGTNAAVSITDSTATLVDISDGSTLNITNRRNSGIILNNVTGTSNFGTTTNNNAIGVTQPAVSLTTVNGAVDFDSLTINQGNAGMGETFPTSFPNDNSGTGDAVYGNGAAGGLTINGGTISNIGDDGFDWRNNSGVLTLNGVTINHNNGAPTKAGIQSYNSQGIIMTGGSILDFGGATAAGQRPLGVNILHDASYTLPTVGTFTFTNVTFNGGVGNTRGGAIAQYTEDNANITLNVSGSSFNNIYGKAIITQNDSFTGATVATNVMTNTFGSPYTGGQSSIEVASGGLGMVGNVAFNISNNTFTNFGDTQGTAILVNLNQATNARTQTNIISDNTITENDGTPAPGGIGIVIDETSGLRLQANNNNVSGVTGTAFSVTGLADWTSGAVDVNMNNSTFSSTGTTPGASIGASGASGTTIELLWNNVDVSSPNSDLGAVEAIATNGGRLDWITTNGNFISLPSVTFPTDATVYVQAGSTSPSPGTICVDFNDDGAGANTTNSGFVLRTLGPGTLLVENGTTPAAIVADNPGMNNGNMTVLGATQADCANAVARSAQQIASSSAERVQSLTSSPFTQKAALLGKPAAPGVIAAGETVTATVPVLPDGKTATFIYDVVVGPVAGVDEIGSAAQVSADGVPPVLTNAAMIPNMDIDKTAVILSETDTDAVIEYVVTAENLGSVPLSGVVISDTLPVGASILLNSATAGSYVPGSGEWTVGTVAANSSETLTLHIELPLAVGDSVTNQAELLSITDLELDSSNNATMVDVTHVRNIFLPIVMKQFANAPDLMVESITTTGDNVEIVVRNVGSTTVNDGFWVDLYVNPTTVPTQPNQLWNIGTGSEGGAVWGLDETNGGLPIAPGDSRTLTLGDAFYFGGSSNLTAVTGGETIYVQVDSYGNGAQLIGNVPETHELTGQPYNNIAGPQTLPPVFTPSATAANSLRR